MQIKSLGYRTDLIFAAFDGEIIDRNEYLAIRTPTNPTFYWGNFLLFDHPPREGDFQKWRELFAKEIGMPPRVVHQSFGWDTGTNEQGVVELFLESVRSRRRGRCVDIIATASTRYRGAWSQGSAAPE